MVPFFQDPNVSNYIPSPPDIVENITSNIDASNIDTAASLLEPTFASQGLGGWSPVGLVQSAFELLHINVGMPWWMTIVVGWYLQFILHQQSY